MTDQEMVSNMESVINDARKMIAELDTAVSRGHWEEAEALCRELVDEIEGGARYASILHDEFMESKA